MKFILVLILTISLVACDQENSSSTPTQPITIDIIGEALPPLQSLGELAKEYTALTGIKIRVHPYEFETAIQKTQLDFLSSNPEYELVMGIFYNYGRYAKSGYVVPFDSERFQHLLPSSEIVGDDAFYPALRNAVMYYEGEKIGYPFSAQTMFLWFRKDLFEHHKERDDFRSVYGYDLPVPDEKILLTWKQYRDIAAFFTRKKGEFLAGEELQSDFFGNALQMKRHPASFYEFTNFIFSFGGSFFDDKGHPTIDIPENLEALQFYIDLKKFAPRGVLQATHDDALAQMQQGRVAMTIMWSDAPSELYREEASVVVNKIGYSLVPIHEKIKRKVAVFGGWGFIINSKGDYQEEAFKFVQWASQPSQQIRWAKMGGLPGAKVIFDDPEYMAIPYMPAQNEALKHLVSWPRDPNSEQFVNDGVEILSSATSEQMSPKEALVALQERAEKLYGN